MYTGLLTLSGMALMGALPTFKMKLSSLVFFPLVFSLLALPLVHEWIFWIKIYTQHVKQISSIKCIISPLYLSLASCGAFASSEVLNYCLFLPLLIFDLKWSGSLHYEAAPLHHPGDALLHQTHHQATCFLQTRNEILILFINMCIHNKTNIKQSFSTQVYYLNSVPASTHFI